MSFTSNPASQYLLPLQCVDFISKKVCCSYRIVVGFWGQRTLFRCFVWVCVCALCSLLNDYCMLILFWCNFYVYKFLIKTSVGMRHKLCGHCKISEFIFAQKHLSWDLNFNEKSHFMLVEKIEIFALFSLLIIFKQNLNYVVTVNKLKKKCFFFKFI